MSSVAFLHALSNDKNYYVTGDCAYTMDHIMVHKLYVSKIPYETTVGVVKEYFSKFGEVKSVHFLVNKDRSYSSNAFVHFESPTVAARVLSAYDILPSLGIGQALYCINVCDSWHQPSCQPMKEILQGKFISTKESGEDQLVSPNRDSILVLNDDCLENIIRLLPIISQLHFARSSPRICRVFHMACKSLYDTLFVDDLGNLTQWEIRDFLDFAGDYIIRIKGKMPERNELHILKFISKFCFNVEEVDLDSTVTYFSLNQPYLQSFRRMKKLKILKLSNKIQQLGKNLLTLAPTIERLSVYCIKANNNHIISFCKSLSNLKELYLGDSLRFNENLANAMAVACENLEILKLSIVNSDYGLFAKLPKLKNLTLFLSMDCNLNPILFNQLIEHKSNILETLAIEGFNCVKNNVAQHISRLKALRTVVCPNSFQLTDFGLIYFCDLKNLEEIDLTDCYLITNTGLLNLVLQCKKLKIVNIQGCSLISNDLIIEIIINMKKQIQKKTFLRTEPVLLMAYSTKIDGEILNSPEYKASSHLIVVDISCHSRKC